MSGVDTYQQKLERECVTNGGCKEYPAMVVLAHVRR